MAVDSPKIDYDSTDLAFDVVIDWLRTEREAYQITKFDYKEKDPNQTVEEWTRQFDSYIQRLPIFGIDTQPGIQAALKLAATAVAMCEHIVAKQIVNDGDLPRPGVPSGTIEAWR